MLTINANFSRVPAKAARAKLSQTDWAVLHAIGLHADKAGIAFPSMARISEITGIARNNIPRSIARLEERGLLRRKRVPKSGGGWQVSHYELIFEPLGDVMPHDDIPPEDIMPDDDTQIAGDVISTHDTQPPGVSSPAMTGCHLHRRQGVMPGDALTYKLTNQGTDLYQEGEVQRVQRQEVETDINRTGRGVISTDDIPHTPPNRKEARLGGRCAYRGCHKPATVAGGCAEHARQVTDIRPD